MTTSPSSAVEQIAARLWKADAEDCGAPASVAEGRTPEAFAEQASEVRARWHKLARAAPTPAPAEGR